MTRNTKYLLLLLIAAGSFGCNTKNHLDRYNVSLDALKTLPDGFYAYRRGSVYFSTPDPEKYMVWFERDGKGNVAGISRIQDFDTLHPDKTIQDKYAIDTAEHKARMQKFIELSRKFRFGHIHIDQRNKISFSYRDGLPEQYVRPLNDSITVIYTNNRRFRLLDNGWFEYID